MTTDSNRAEQEVKNRVRSLQRRGEVAGDGWEAIPAEIRSWLKHRASNYAEDGEAPEAAARHAIRRGQREGKLPPP